MSDKKITIEVIKDFKFAHRGCDVVEYSKGETVDVSEECAAIALDEKWAKKPGGKKQIPENKAVTGAPENKEADEVAGENDPAAQVAGVEAGAVAEASGQGE